MPPPYPYSVIGQELTEELSPAGQFVDTWRITYQSPDGTVGYVRVTQNAYTPTNVDALIQADISRIMGVAGLGVIPTSQGG